MTISVFSYLSTNIQTPLTNAGVDASNALLSYASTILSVGLVLYVALIGYQVMTGVISSPYSDIIRKIALAALVLMLINTAGFYQTYVYQFFVTNLPNEISQVITNAGVSGTAPSSNVFDTAVNTSINVYQQLVKNTSIASPIESLETVLSGILFLAAMGLCLVLLFAMWLYIQITMVLLIAVGPLLIPLVLFPITRPTVEKWLGYAIALVLKQVLITLFLTIFLGTLSNMLDSLYTGASTSDGSDPIASNIGIVVEGVLFAFFSAYVGLQIPQMATAIAGGADFQAAQLARGLSSFANMAKGAAGTFRSSVGSNTPGTNGLGSRTSSYRFAKSGAAPGPSLSDGG